MKMVDIVTQTMPAENEVHVARNFLTKILRSSMRRSRFKGRNESTSRPHSWHASKLAESDPQKITQTSGPEPVWQSKHSISSSSTDVSKCWDLMKQPQTSSGQSIEPVEVFPPSITSSTSLPSSRHHSTAEISPGGTTVNPKRDSPHTPLSALCTQFMDPSSPPKGPTVLASAAPAQAMSAMAAASMECMFYRGVQSEPGGQGAAERPRYLQLPMGNGGRVSPRLEEQGSMRQSSSSMLSYSPNATGCARSNINPVWNVPEGKKPTSPSPPPPPPPLRSDSFAATKVHEMSLSGSYPEGPGPGPYTPPQQKVQGRSSDRLFKVSESLQRTLHCVSTEHPGETRHGCQTAQRSDKPPPYQSPDDQADVQLSSTITCRLGSLSTTDVRQGPSRTEHQKQHSDESQLYLHSKQTSSSSSSNGSAAGGGGFGGGVSASKSQNVAGYYRSLQDLPANIYSRMQNRTSTASLSSGALDQGGKHTRHYSTSCQKQQPSGRVPQPEGPQGRLEALGTERESIYTAGERSQVGPLRTAKGKYAAPHPVHSYCKQGEGPPSNGLNVWMTRAGTQDRECRSGGVGAGDGHNHRHAHVGGGIGGPQQLGESRMPLSLQSQSNKEAQPPQSSWVAQEGCKICPQHTPLLHSLALENRLLSEKQTSTVMTASTLTNQDTSETTCGAVAGKQSRRSDRYATTLRNEIIIKRAQLQKSRSAAALSCSYDAEEEQEASAWRCAEASTSSSDGSFSNTYKDHLKEAQARVLQATSFKRKDLELHGNDAPGGVVVRRDLTVAEILSGKVGSGASDGGGGTVVSRIGSRKRFPMTKRVHSFSEPDKINEVGMEGKTLDSIGSFVDRRMFFEGVSKPALYKPSPKPGATQDPSEEQAGTRSKGSSPAKDHLYSAHVLTKPHSGTDHGWPGHDNSQPPVPCPQQSFPQPQAPRLGTFAEYEATWNLQRRQASEAKSSGKYRSAENILEPSAEEGGPHACVHERSRSSPSADFYEQKIPLPGRKSLPEQPMGTRAVGVSADCSVPESREWIQLPQPPHLQVAATDPSTLPRRTEPERRDVPPMLPHVPDHRPPHSAEPPTYAEHVRHAGVTATSEQHHFPKKMGSSSSMRLSPPKAEPMGVHGETTSSRTGSLEHQTKGSQVGQPPRGKSPCLGLASQVPSVPSLGVVSPLGAPTCPNRELQVGSRLEEEWKVLHQTALAALEPLPLPQGSLLPSVSPCSYKGGTLTLPSGPARSPSPQFVPPRLTDKPPDATHPSTHSTKILDCQELNDASKRVPIRIIHAESSLERKGRQCLLNNTPLVGSGGPATPPQSNIPSPEHSMPFPSTPIHQKKEEVHGTGSSPSGTQGVPAPLIGAPQDGEARGSAFTPPREHWDEEVKREELARDIMGKDKSLADILDQSRMRTTMDLMGGIFPQGGQVLEVAQQRRRAAPKQTSTRTPGERRVEEELGSGASVAPVVSSSTYYSTSAPKAELLIKMKDMQQQMQEEEQDSEDELDYDLSSKKQELILSLSRKLQVLREARESVQEDVQDNNALGQEVEATVQEVCRPNELDKFRMFIGDLDKVVSLLLSLSGRLARVENALNNLEEGASTEEKHALTEKRRLLIGQHEDAKELKENLDRRERLVYEILASHLSAEHLADYEHFVKMKSALIIEQRKLEDKIKLGEEQLKCLRDSLPLEQRLLF